MNTTLQERAIEYISGPTTNNVDQKLRNWAINTCINFANIERHLLFEQFVKEATDWFLHLSPEDHMYVTTEDFKKEMEKRLMKDENTGSTPKSTE